MKIAVLTGGGDCPGLNAAIRAIVRAADRKGDEVIGILEGWKGLMEGNAKPLLVEKTSGLLAMGGTILGSSRVNPLVVPDGTQRSFDFFKSQNFDALIAIGGEGTLKVASYYSERGMPIVLVPKTIDNDTWGTDYTIGFDTAVHIATEAIDRLQTTAESHSRIMIVEVMGRHAGWIATYAGIAGGADAILTPEEEFPIEELCQIIQRRAERKRHFSILVVAEDARIRMEDGSILKTPLQKDEYGDVKLGGIGDLLGQELKQRTDSEVRVTVLGHVQRGGAPTAFDRVLATRLGVFAVDMVHEGKCGMMAALKGANIEAVPFLEIRDRLKTVDPEISKTARILFG